MYVDLTTSGRGRGEGLVERCSHDEGREAGAEDGGGNDAVGADKVPGDEALVRKEERRGRSLLDMLEPIRIIPLMHQRFVSRAIDHQRLEHRPDHRVPIRTTRLREVCEGPEGVVVGEEGGDGVC